MRGDWGDWATGRPFGGGCAARVAVAGTGGFAALGGSPRLPHGEAKAVRGDWGTAGRAGLGAAPWVTAVTGGPRLVGVAGGIGDAPPPGW